ncbi:uncharacterized protein LOC128180198 isoform X2 [Crassostrea angulata]|nr:uncharacterized protein LOC128180198 isoform X2 [Crassostrea angulata]XP_052704073.1 uncharacterized protein LOC128180198 isoform X2 [Crassostrea angulata]
MDRDFYILLVLVLLQYQMCECGNRYCKEAVNSVEIVTACPTSKTEWEIAARKKNCERIASRQKCDSRERFKYHCVINGFRNKMVEVCAPLRIIFGHCTEFNIHGGVIQNQRSTLCNDTFPKCDLVYNSSDAYKFTDCYKLVTNGENLSTTPKYASTSSTSGSIINIKPGSVETLIIIAAVHLVLFLIFIIIVAFSNYKFFPCCSLTRQPTSSCSHRL